MHGAFRSIHCRSLALRTAHPGSVTTARLFVTSTFEDMAARKGGGVAMYTESRAYAFCDRMR